jgi:lysozyme family protein
MDFNASFDRLISPKVEGGFTLNPKDSGNWTGGKIGVGELKGSNFGISAAAYPKLDIKNLTREKVRPLYLNA